MRNEKHVEDISQGHTSLGIELGSTRIKAVLIGSDNIPVASGGYDWTNKLEDGIWTYDLETVHEGLRESYRNLCLDVEKKYGIGLKKIGAMGISAMMHGYLAFDENDQILVPFRTWRNTSTGKAAKELTEAFNFNIPLRWSIAHLYQAILDNEPHVKKIRYITTLAGYVHGILTGEKVLGIGDASGMFPVSDSKKAYDEDMLNIFEKKISTYGFSWKIRDILPDILDAGENAGYLTEEGGAILDPAGNLEPGIPMAPPEGDAGTGMVATNSVASRTGNVSAGTSIFAMLVLEKPLSRVYPEIDIVTTPAGRPVAMVHCNNGTSDLDSWVRIFSQLIDRLGLDVDKGFLYDKLYEAGTMGEPDCGGVVVNNYLSGEHITGISEGRPFVIRRQGSNFDLNNLMRAQFYSLLASLRIGMEILYKEGVSLERLTGHGGFFKTPLVGQQFMADALEITVSVMETAGEGGPYGMALLASYMLQKEKGETLEEYLDNKVFSGLKITSLGPDKEGTEGFLKYLDTYKKSLEVEKAAVYNL